MWRSRACMLVCMGVCACMCDCLYVCARVHFVYMCMRVWADACVCVCVHVCIDVYMRMYVCVYIRICVCVYVCICVYTHACVYVYMWYTCMCICLRRQGAFFQKNHKNKKWAEKWKCLHISRKVIKKGGLKRQKGVGYIKMSSKLWRIHFYTLLKSLKEATWSNNTHRCGVFSPHGERKLARSRLEGGAQSWTSWPDARSDAMIDTWIWGRKDRILM